MSNWVAKCPWPQRVPFGSFTCYFIPITTLATWKWGGQESVCNWAVTVPTWVCTLRFQGHHLSVKEQDSHPCWVTTQNYLQGPCQMEFELFPAEKDGELAFLDCNSRCKIPVWQFVTLSVLHMDLQVKIWLEWLLDSSGGILLILYFRISVQYSIKVAHNKALHFHCERFDEHTEVSQVHCQSLPVCFTSFDGSCLDNTQAK